MHIAVDGRLMYHRKAGIANYTRRLVQALAARQGSHFTLQVLLDRRDADTYWVPENVAIIRTITPAHHKFEPIALPVELSRFDIDVLHSPDFITCPGRFRKVITIHDLYFMEHPEVMGADGRRYYSRVRRSASMADRIITPSHFTRGDVLRLLPEVSPDHVCVAHEAADEVSEMPSALLLGDLPYILFVGTLEPRKNLVTLLRALGRLPAEIKLTVVGSDGWASTGPAKLAHELGVHHRVTLTGRVSNAELDALYRGARAFAMPSLSEGFGLPVLEAMARGIPVVCSNSGSLPEIAGHAALLHDPLDDAALAQHLLAVWHDDAAHAGLAQRGIARAAQFSWDRAAVETLAIYQAARQNRKSAI